MKRERHKHKFYREKKGNEKKLKIKKKYWEV